MKMEHIKTKYEDCYLVGGKREGEYKRYWSNGKLGEHCFYSKDKLEGEYKRYWDNGKLETIKYYENGKEVKSKFEIKVLKKLWKK